MGNTDKTTVALSKYKVLKKKKCVKQIVAETWGSLLFKVDRPESVPLSWTCLSVPLKSFFLDLTGHVHTTDILTLKRP